MAFFDKLRQSVTRFGAKASATAHLHHHGRAAWLQLGAPAWSDRSYHRLAREGYAKNVIAQRCVRLVAECAASVPIRLRDGEASLDSHPFLDRLAAPNPMLSGRELFEEIYAYLLLSGNAFLERVDGTDGRPAELHVLRPDRMTVIPGETGWPEAYEFKIAGQTHRFPVDPVTGRSAVLHLKAFNPFDDHYGFSALQAGAMGIDIHNAASGWNKALLDNAARPSGALIFEPGEGAPGNLTEEQLARLKSEMDEQFQGAANAGRPLLLEGGLKWQQMAFSPADMDFINAKHVAAREIALAFGVPPMLLGIPGDNTYSNYQEANRAFWRLTLLPLVDKVLAGLSRWLGAGAGQGLQLVADKDALPALAPEREALYARLERTSFLTANEKRAAVGLGPVEGGDALAPAVSAPRPRRGEGGGRDPFERGLAGQPREAKAQAVLAARAARFAELSRALEEARGQGKTVKIWRTQQDGRVRASHQAMEGVRVAIDEPFALGGEALFLPCDPDGSLEETAGCRCFLEFEEDTGVLPEFGGDRSFIEEQEGGLQTQASVPADDGAALGDSGATIGIGIDLGQRDAAELRRLGVDEALIEKVKPFLGLQGEAAKRALEAQPLRLSEAEARALSNKVLNDIIRRVAANFNADSRFDFFALPPEAQTVIADVAIQFGPNLANPDEGTPDFWGFVIRGEWGKAIEELRNFGDQFDDRRNDEARRLERALPELRENF